MLIGQLALSIMAGYVAATRPTAFAICVFAYFTLFMLFNLIPVIRGVPTDVDICESSISVRTYFASEFVIPCGSINHLGLRKGWVFLSMYQVELHISGRRRPLALPATMDGIGGLVEYIRTKNPQCTTDAAIEELLSEKRLQ